jgi:hypothetical protein
MPCQRRSKTDPLAPGGFQVIGGQFSAGGDNADPHVPLHPRGPCTPSRTVAAKPEAERFGLISQRA